MYGSFIMKKMGKEGILVAQTLKWIKDISSRHLGLEWVSGKPSPLLKSREGF